MDTVRAFVGCLLDLGTTRRVAELSRMLAGASDSAHARGHAEELIVEARRVREASRPGRRG